MTARSANLPRTSVMIELHPAIKQYLGELADDTGFTVPKIIRLCMERALPEVEALVRTTEHELPDRLSRARAGKNVYEDEKVYKPRLPSWMEPPLPTPAIVGVLTGQAAAGISLEFVNHGDTPDGEPRMPVLVAYPSLPHQGPERRHQEPQPAFRDDDGFEAVPAQTHERPVKRRRG